MSLTATWRSSVSRSIRVGSMSTLTHQSNALTVGSDCGRVPPRNVRW